MKLKDKRSVSDRRWKNLEESKNLLQKQIIRTTFSPLLKQRLQNNINTDLELLFCPPGIFKSNIHNIRSNIGL